jgi:hypothetical protein
MRISNMLDTPLILLQEARVFARTEAAACIGSSYLSCFFVAAF